MPHSFVKRLRHLLLFNDVARLRTETRSALYQERVMEGGDDSTLRGLLAEFLRRHPRRRIIPLGDELEVAPNGRYRHRPRRVVVFS